MIKNNKSTIYFLLILLSFVFPLNAKNVLGYGIKGSMKLSDKDKVLDLTEEVVAGFDEDLSVQGFQTPINKAVTLQNGTNIFIAIGFDLTIEKYLSEISKDKALNLHEAKMFDLDKRHINLLFAKKNGLFSTRYIYQSDTLKMPVLIYMTGTDSLKIYNYYNDTNYFRSNFEID